MLIKVDKPSADGNDLLTHDQKVFIAGGFYIKAFVDGVTGLKGPMSFVPPGTLLYEMAEMSESTFIQYMKTRPPLPITQDFTDRDWGAIHHMILDACRQLERAGKNWRKRLGDIFKPNDFRNGKLRT